MLARTRAYFDEMTPFVHFKVARHRASPVPFRRDHREGAAIVKFLAPPIIVESLVADRRGDLDPVDQRRHADAVVPVSGSSTKRAKLPSALTNATILVVKPPRDRPMA
jgi:hypothetical protein